MRTITGKELDKAILKSQGRTWDGMPIPKLQVTDLRREAIDLFKEKALKKRRLKDPQRSTDVPLIQWQVEQQEVKIVLPISVQAHHSFADGLHIGQFAELLQKFFINKNKRYILCGHRKK